VKHNIRQRLLIVLIAVLSVGIVASIAFLVWYDATQGYTAPPPSAGQDESLNQLSTVHHEAAISRTLRNVARDGFLGRNLERYRLRAGRYPESLEGLLEKPANLAPEQWNGPYVSTPAVLDDPWGNRYQYRQPGVYNSDSYDLWSTGPDGRDDTVDDLVNW
jgi:type II secretion system protein G